MVKVLIVLGMVASLLILAAVGAHADYWPPSIIQQIPSGV